ncbi:chemotaxis protein histidine kinase-like protein [Leptolyngbya sp. Heron Island J]|nr:chemotaxis protein histidine kinase-like protein [Leptolyngbya sp. Heron Island J]
MTSDSVSSQQIPAYFLQEASELLQQMDNELQTLHQDFGVQKVYALMRTAHTLKGAAASVGLEHIKTTTHSLENVFRALCDPNATLTPAVESLIFEAYSCLQLLLSAQTATTQIDESSILERMADVISNLENHLGNRFGQNVDLPNSSALGVDITQSVFEKGVDKRLQELENALETPEPAALTALLRAHADVFSGLAESFNLPGFGDIVRTTLKALDRRPELVIQIAQIALDDYRAGQRQVLEGDRTRGGEPSLMLKKLATPPKPSKNNWLGQVWNALNQPIPRTATPPKPHPPQTLTSPQPAKSLPHQGGGVDDLLAPTAADSIAAPLTTNDDLLTTTSPNVEVVNDGANRSLSADGPPPAVLSDPPGRSTSHTSSLKVSVDHLEQINHAIGDLLTQQNRQTLYHEQLTVSVKTLLKQLGQQQRQLIELQSQATSVTNTLAHTPSTEHQFDALELDHYSELQLQVQSSLDTLVQQLESAEAIELFVRHSTQTIQKQQRLINSLRETLVEARMQPIESIFQRFHQVLGRLVAQQGKPVELTIEGGHVLVDKMIADKLYEPLLHLVRNAFDHGIEKPWERQQQEKEDSAQIQLSAKQEGHHLNISVRDNGRGLNLEAICQKAIYQQLITPTEAQQLTPEQISHLIFRPGFSTTAQVNDLSGRGFGLDAARAQVQALQGQITISHKPHQETCFTLKIPTNLTIAKLLVCQAGETLYTFMTDAIEQILIPKPEQISTRKNNKVLSWQIDGKECLIPLISLTKSLTYHATLPPNYWPETKPAVERANPVILMRHHERIVGLESDQLLGEQELVIRSLGNSTPIPDYIYGCSILPDGRLSLVIDAAALTLEALQRSAPKSHGVVVKPAPTRRPPKPTGKQSILVVDDSITVRNTLTQGLQKSGYMVIQAKEGNEALQKLHHSQVTAILCDLEMPGMNGFDFLRARRQIPEIAAIPTIMLTSRTGNKHRQLAEDLGANNYLTKPYLMPQLLATINNVLSE